MVQTVSVGEKMELKIEYLPIKAPKPYSVVGMPPAARTQEMGDKNKRIHHAVEWESCVPMILNECYKKRSEMNGE